MELEGFFTVRVRHCRSEAVVEGSVRFGSSAACGRAAEWARTTLYSLRAVAAWRCRWRPAALVLVLALARTNFIHPSPSRVSNSHCYCLQPAGVQAVAYY